MRGGQVGTRVSVTMLLSVMAKHREYADTMTIAPCKTQYYQILITLHISHLRINAGGHENGSPCYRTIYNHVVPVRLNVRTPVLH
jgi:hypothetical protein